MIKRFLLFLLVTSALSGCRTEPENTPSIKFERINSCPHDINSFTEGLLVHKGELYESTGATKDLAPTRSLFGTVNILSGEINVKAEIDRTKYFGEGITILNGKVFQLTYKSKIGFIYNDSTFEKIGKFTIPSAEGWGLTTDGKNLIMSDGTDKLTYINPETLKVLKTVSVTENGKSANYLNELEYIKGYIYANVWTTNSIVKINPASGKIVGRLDLTTLANDARLNNPGSLEMNGIAYMPETGIVLVTGKMWPKIYLIKFAL